MSEADFRTLAEELKASRLALKKKDIDFSSEKLEKYPYHHANPIISDMIRAEIFSRTVNELKSKQMETPKVEQFFTPEEKAAYMKKYPKLKWASPEFLKKQTQAAQAGVMTPWVRKQIQIGALLRGKPKPKPPITRKPGPYPRTAKGTGGLTVAKRQKTKTHETYSPLAGVKGTVKQPRPGEDFSPEEQSILSKIKKKPKLRRTY